MEEINLENLPYREGVGMVVFNKNGLVWVGCRLPKTTLEKQADARLWQFPQGGVDSGEDLLVAAQRELLEETSMTSLQLLGEMPTWLYYDFPAEVARNCLGGKYRGQKQKWFAFRFTGEDKEIILDRDEQGIEAEFSTWCWCEIDQAVERVVHFKKDLYLQVVEYFRPFVR